ncbi:hypothetical protein QR77_12135 [Streptomyces sp. 150FB]|uniref:DUF6507 family protein n=1 Tax=Streptomyces sp. 150FB TaxID=1576605 RepID=UPI0005893137|nr:DUF6507 family protein [Streptomyces sp. 150FB]KIF74526.1 hypothetical protein QR77_12135 [Streptomyces sp. 150FB]
MTAWDIQPQGVQGQLKVTGGHAGELEKALNGLVTTLSDAATAAGTAVPGSQASTPLAGPVAPGHAALSQKATGPVAGALAQYLHGRETDLKAMAERIQAAVLGAAKATNAYVEGDLEAAKHAQDAARTLRLDLLKDNDLTGGGR